MAPRAPKPQVRFNADKDFTPDHRTISFTAGLQMTQAEVMAIFCVETPEQLLEAFAAYGVDAELLD